MPFSTKPFWFILVLLTFLSGEIRASQDAVTSACTDYWERSYKHPYLNKADSLRGAEQFNAALKLYQQAAENFKYQENWEGLLKARNLTSDILRTRYYYDTALLILEGNLKIIKEHLDSDPEHMAQVYHIQGVNYDWQKKYDFALESYLKALQIRIELYGEIHMDVVLTYSAIGEMYLYRDQFMNAKKYLSLAVDIIEKLNCNSLTQVGYTYYYLASAYRRLRDSEKAGIYGLKALSIHKSNTVTDQTRCYNLLGNLHHDMQNYSQSNQYNFQAIKLLIEQSPLSDTQYRALANYYNSVANNYLESKEYDSAQNYFRRSLRIYESLDGVAEDISLSYQNMGINFSLMEEYDSARFYLMTSMEMRKQIYGTKNYSTCSSLINIGELYELIGEPDSALSYYQQALIAGSGDEFTSMQLAHNPPASAFTYDGRLLEALWAKGEVLNKVYQQNQAQEQLELALETFLVAIDLIDRNQKLYQLEGSSLLMAGNYFGIFESTLNVCYQLYQVTNQGKYLETAFSVIEKSKARLLFDTFSDLHRSELLGIPDSLMNQENQLKARLASLNRELENEKQDSNDPLKIQSLQEQVFQSNIKLENYYQSLDSIYPSYTSAVKNELQDLTSIQNRISNEGKLLLNYFWGDSSLFTLAIKEDRIQFTRQPIDVIMTLVDSFKQHLTKGPQFDQQAARFEDFSNVAHTLYRFLLDEFILSGIPMIIAADGPLRFIPFEALVVEEPQRSLKNYHQLKYVIHDSPVSYIYSANLWAIQPRNQATKLQALGFSYSNSQTESSLPNDLPGTAVEINVVKNKIGGLFYGGLEATKQRFLDHARDYEIIHLAVHGISDSISRLNNRLLFRNPEDPESSEALYSYELYDLRLNSKLVVLSACESGTGRNYQGEGVYSMSRAFSYAGVPTTVMSLWRISDNSTPEILERFYDMVTSGEPIDQALRQAKLKYLDDNPGMLAHPGLWSAMVVHGISDPVTSKKMGLKWPLVALFVLGLGLLLLRKIYPRSN